MAVGVMRAGTGMAGSAGERLGHRWQGLPLHLRFALAGSAVMLAGMMVIGWWVSREIEDSVTRNAAISSALYMESFIAPISQELSTADALPPETAASLDRLFAEPHFARRIASVKIWKKGGRVVFATDPALIGQTFAPTEKLRAAWQGDLSAAFDDLEHAASHAKAMPENPYLEVYNPIHSINTGEIIAVAEFYMVATELENDLFRARLTSWLLVACVTASIFVALFGIVRQGSRTIERQTEQLRLRFDEVVAMSEQNAELRRRVQSASLRAGELNERHLRRIGAELHDGPAQALALASLRLDSAFNGGAGNGDVETIRASLDSAMREIRTISAGLSLPEIAGRSVHETLTLAADMHERRTGTSVARDLAPELRSLNVGHPQLICIYRFAQEALNNAFRHAKGAGQRIYGTVDGGTLTVSVSDDGPGFDVARIEQDTERLGLRGLRERVESTGGSFHVRSAPGEGTRLEITLPIED